MRTRARVFAINPVSTGGRPVAKKNLGLRVRAVRFQRSVPRCAMSIKDGYAWYLALVWPDAEGVPTAVIRDWDPGTKQLGRIVETVHFSENKSFQRVIEDLDYELSPTQMPAVTAKGVYVVLRRETVPVTVRANRAATVGA
jgi:hypothetical protein